MSYVFGYVCCYLLLTFEFWVAYATSFCELGWVISKFWVGSKQRIDMLGWLLMYIYTGFFKLVEKGRVDAEVLWLEWIRTLFLKLPN